MPRVKMRGQNELPDYLKQKIDVMDDPEIPNLAGAANQLPAVMLKSKDVPDIRKLSSLQNIQFAKQAQMQAPGSTQEASAKIETNTGSEPMGSQEPIIPKEETPFPYHLYAGMNNQSSNLSNLKQKAIPEVVQPPIEEPESAGFLQSLLPKSWMDYIENKPDTAEKLRSLMIAEEDLSPTSVRQETPARELLPRGVNEYVENTPTASTEEFEKTYMNPQPKGVMSERQYNLYNSMMPEVRNLLPADVKSDMKAYEDNEIIKFNENSKQNKGQPDLVPGAVEALIADPTASAQFGKITGVDINDPKIQAELKAHSDLYDETDETLRAEKEKIKDRLENGTMTDRDYFMLGLAVLIPTIISGAFGGFESAGAALAGGAGSVAESMKQAQKLEREDERRLSEIEKERIANATSLADIGEKIQKRHPKDKISEAFEGTPTETYVDPKTGEKKEYMRIDDTLFYDTSRLRSGDPNSNIKIMYKKVENAEQKGGFIDVMHVEGTALENIYQQLIDQGFNTFYASRAANIPSLGQYFQNLMAATVTDPETGEKTNSAVAIKHYRDKMRDSYRASQPGKTPVLTAAQIAHFNAMVPDPYNAKDAVDAKEAQTAIKRFNSIARNEYINNMSSQGFSRQRLEKKYVTPVQIRRAEEKKTQQEKDIIKESENIIEQEAI